MKEKKKYKAQALAISMVVLVVSSIIAISVYSRILKDKGLSVEERASAEALEVSDLLLDKLTTLPINTIITAVESVTEGAFPYPGGVQLKENNTGGNQITQLLTELGINYTLNDIGFCKPVDGNEYIVTIKEADADTPYKIRAGQVWSLPVDGKAFTEECSLALKVKKGDTNSGFLMSSTYAKYDTTNKITEYKPYTSEDTESYCFSDDTTTCNNTNFKDPDNWEKYTPGDTLTLPLLSPASPDEYKLVEISVKAIGGKVGITYTMGTENSCIEGFRMIQLRASAYCNSVYRGKEVLIPEKKWSNALFDYVVFNGEGSM
ncbi:MAG: hypothetical protein AB9915_02790 [Candidatus Dojkabacteria bacterium]